MATRMLQRRGTAAEWAAMNPILAEGEIGYETDTRIMKIGDGETDWFNLSLSTLTKQETSMEGALIPLAPTDPSHAARMIDVVNKAGDTMTGPLSLIAPTEASHAARLTDVTDATASVPLRVVRSNKDSNDIFTTIEWFRQDTTKDSQSVLSGGTSPEYTTRTVTEYEADGTTVKRTTAYTLTYDVDGDLTTEVFV